MPRGPVQGGGGGSSQAGTRTDTPGFRLFDFVNNSDVSTKTVMAGDGARVPGFPPKVLRLALAIAKRAPGELTTPGREYTQKTDWAFVGDLLPSQQKATRALSVLGGKFWFNGQPFSPPQHGGTDQP